MVANGGFHVLGLGAAGCAADVSPTRVARASWPDRHC